MRCTANELLERMSERLRRREDRGRAVRPGLGHPHPAPDRRPDRSSITRRRSPPRRASPGGPTWTSAADRLTRLTATLSADPLSVAPAEVERADRLSPRDPARCRGHRRAPPRPRRSPRRVPRAAGAAGHRGRGCARRARGAAREDRGALGTRIARAAPRPRSRARPDRDPRRLGRLARGAPAPGRMDRPHPRAARRRAADPAAPTARRSRRATSSGRCSRPTRSRPARLGAIEDPELERIFTDAHEALYIAPTDLSVAAQLVRRYQERLNAPRPTKEAIR